MRSQILCAALLFLLPSICFPQSFFAIGTLSPAAGWNANSETKHLAHMSWAATGKYGSTNHAAVGFLYFIGHQLPLSVPQIGVEQLPPFRIRRMTSVQDGRILQIELHVQQSTLITIEFLTLLGQKLQTARFRSYPAESFSVLVPIPPAASGVYYLRIHSMGYATFYPVKIVR